MYPKMKTSSGKPCFGGGELHSGAAAIPLESFMRGKFIVT